jgi:ABC-2 type transport system permease protein
VQVLLRLRSEEASGTAESVLAAAVPRSRLVRAHVLNVAIGSLLLVELFAVSMALATGAVTSDPTGQLSELAPAALVQLPAILALAMAVVALVGLLPRAAVALSWTLLVATFVIGPMFGPGLGLPRWVQDLSPFTHVPMLPAAELTLTPLAVLSLVAVTLAATGTVALRHRDLVLPA